MKIPRIKGMKHEFMTYAADSFLNKERSCSVRVSCPSSVVSLIATILIVKFVLADTAPASAPMIAPTTKLSVACSCFR